MSPRKLLPLAVLAISSLALAQAEPPATADAGALAVETPTPESTPEVAPPPAAKPEKSAASLDDELGSSDYFGQLEKDLGKLTVVAASQQEEPVKEAPVPVTIITQEMLRSIGARNLLEALVIYVPGMTQAEDHNEMNVAMRGVYASSQQKVLILVDGHRINSRAYSNANPDFGIGLDKVKHIEVLRGPGSSVYGNVALTAVINIVTRDPGELNGVLVRGGLGNHGQKTASITMGKRFDVAHDVLLWGHLYEATGENRTIDRAEDFAAVPRGGTAILGGVRGLSYDVGFKYHLANFTFFYNSRRGSYVEPFSGGGVTGEVYDYNAFRSLNRIGPGLTTSFNHAEAKYAKTVLSWLDVEALAYYDTAAVEGVVVSNPVTRGGFFLGFHDDTLGAQVQGRARYDLGFLGSGNVTVGVQAERMRLLDSTLMLEGGGEFTMSGDKRETPVLSRGEESVYSAFAQVKHRFTDLFLTSLGLRYDNKDRWTGDNVTNVSPRLALIFTPSDDIDVKASFATAFVDAPFWYRYNNLASYRGAVGLTPEQLSSAQLTPTFRFFGGRLVSTTNLFYNHLYKFIFRNNNAVAPDPIYQNAGVLRTVGIEEEVSYTRTWLRVRANFTFQHLLEGKDYGTRNNEIFNVPRTSGNLVINVNPLHEIYNKAWLDLTVRYIGTQLSPVNIAFANGVTYSMPDNRLPAVALVNVGFRLNDVVVDGLTVDATVYNLFDTRWSQGGSTTHAYPQMGRWFMARVSWQFDPLSL